MASRVVPSARLMVHLTPRGGRDAIDGWTADGVLRVRVAAARSGGAANESLTRLLAAALDIAPSRVRVLLGASSRTKTVAVNGMDAESVQRAIASVIGPPVLTSEYVWEPLSPEGVRAHFAAFPARWWIAGGWAIDLFVGRQTREHGDIDVAILRDDVPLLSRAIAGWDIQIPHDGSFRPWYGGPLAPHFHQFWCRPQPNAAWAFEILVEDAAAATWYFRRDHHVRAPLSSFGSVSPAGMPYVAAEIALLYKAKWHDVDRHAADFDIAAPMLSESARVWLRAPLATAHPDHPWISRL